MNRGLRDTFAPVFVLFELKTIVLCLRNRAIQQTTEIDRLLARSLLAERLQEVLRRGTDIRSTVAALADTMTGAAATFRQLETVYTEEGLKGFENNLMRVYLEHVVENRLHPVIRKFFVLFIDLRNIMLLYKHLRWGVEDGSLFISGGAIELPRFQQTLARKDPADLDALVTSVTGLKTLPFVASEGSLETVLLRSMTKQLRKIGRESEDVGLIVDYVWLIYVQARNLAVLHHGKQLDAGTLERELIL